MSEASAKGFASQSRSHIGNKEPIVLVLLITVTIKRSACAGGWAELSAGMFHSPFTAALRQNIFFPVLHQGERGGNSWPGVGKRGGIVCREFKHNNKTNSK